eukprot:6459689-Amphidinium_carterae.3
MDVKELNGITSEVGTMESASEAIPAAPAGNLLRDHSDGVPPPPTTVTRRVPSGNIGSTHNIVTRLLSA